MLLIPCPWCGGRDEAEFTYGGDAASAMPALDGNGGSDEWHRFVHLRANPNGLHREYWHHTAGCERWLIVERNTASHVVCGATDAGLRKTGE